MSDLQRHLDRLGITSQQSYIKTLQSMDPFMQAVPQKPAPPGPKFRVITDQGAEFVVEAIDFDLNFSYAGVLGNRLRLSGKIVSPTNLPGFVHPESERQITIPDEPS